MEGIYGLEFRQHTQKYSTGDQSVRLCGIGEFGNRDEISTLYNSWPLDRWWANVCTVSSAGKAGTGGISNFGRGLCYKWKNVREGAVIQMEGPQSYGKGLKQESKDHELILTANISQPMWDFCTISVVQTMRANVVQIIFYSPKHEIIKHQYAPDL